jgi:hypothetical protein
MNNRSCDSIFSNLYDDFGLFHSPRVCFYRSTFEIKRFNSTFFIKTIFASVVYLWIYFARKCKLKSTGCMVIMLNFTILRGPFAKWRIGIYPIVPATRFPWLGTMWLIPIRIFKKEFQEMNFRSQNEMISTVTMILSKVPVWMFSGVFDQWTERLHDCNTNGWEYV